MGNTNEIINKTYWFSYREDTTFENAYNFVENALELIKESSNLVGGMLDVSQLEMLNSSGIGLLVDFYKEIISKDLKFLLVTNNYVSKI